MDGPSTVRPSPYSRSTSSGRSSLDNTSAQGGVSSAIEYVRRRVDDPRDLLRVRREQYFERLAGRDRQLRRSSSSRATHPTVLQQTHDAAPQVHEILRFYPPFRDLVMGLYPIVTDLTTLESLVHGVVADDSATPSDIWKEQASQEEALSHAQVAVVLASLALGCQFGELDAASRQDISRDLANRSSRCLQQADCTGNPSIEAVQALLLIGLAHQNLGQSNSAWILLGLTHRIAQSLGLDRSQPRDTDGKPSRGAHQLWKAILWQDALLSIRHDRQLLHYDVHQMRGDGTFTAGSELSYFDAMAEISLLTVQLLKEPGVQLDDLQTRRQLLYRQDDVLSNVCLHLRPGQMRMTLQQRSEHLLLQMHANLLAAEICRPGYSSRPTDDAQCAFREEGIGHLRKCLHAFLDLCQFSRVALRSWSITQGAINASLLLAMLHPHLDADVDDVRELLRNTCKALQVDTGTPQPDVEKQRPCVGLSETRMRASEVLGSIVDASSRGLNVSSAGPDDLLQFSAPTGSSAIMTDPESWPLDVSLFDPTFATDMEHSGFGYEWLNELR